MCILVTFAEFTRIVAENDQNDNRIKWKLNGAISLIVVATTTIANMLFCFYIPNGSIPKRFHHYVVIP